MHSKVTSHPINLSVAYLSQSPFGQIGLAASEAGLAFLEMQTRPEVFEEGLRLRGFIPQQDPSALLQQAIEQLAAYFHGRLRAFSLPIDWQRLTPFQEQVLRRTFAIPYGQVKTYGEIASEIGKPGAARAVGQVEAHNPIPIIIPCHRVVGRHGSLHGYSAADGLETKARLLRLEGVSI